MLLVYRYRIKSLTGLLGRQARACNFVWNFCNETQRQALKWNKRWPTGFDLNRLTAGSSKELALHARTINAVCEQYAKSRRQRNRAFLRWRGRRSLGWVPLKGCDLKRSGDAFRFAGNTFRVFNSRPLPEGKIKDGTNFSCDARGRWFLNIVMEVAAPDPRPAHRGIGIDLGHHKLSMRIVREFDYIAVGNVKAAGLAKTRLAKSVLDAGWSSFRGMLRYKATAHGASYEEVDESFSTRVCSFCDCKTGPKGVADLGIRSWVCAVCGVSHDRDVNSARNIYFRSGHRTPAEGILAL
jgi:transposase